jgi:hypothetical protein
MAAKTNHKRYVYAKNRVNNFCTMHSEHRLESSGHRATGSGTLSTTSGKNTCRLSRESRDAIIVLLAIGSGFWLLYCFFKLFKNYGQYNFDNILKRIKSETENTLDDGRRGPQYREHNMLKP